MYITAAVCFDVKHAGEGGRGDKHFTIGLNSQEGCNKASISSSEDPDSSANCLTSSCKNESEINEKNQQQKPLNQKSSYWHDFRYASYPSLLPNLLYEKILSTFDSLTHFRLWQKPARMNQLSDNYHPGSILDYLPVIWVTTLRIFTCDKS